MFYFLPLNRVLSYIIVPFYYQGKYMCICKFHGLAHIRSNGFTISTLSIGDLLNLVLVCIFISLNLILILQKLGVDCVKLIMPECFLLHQIFYEFYKNAIFLTSLVCFNRLKSYLKKYLWKGGNVKQVLMRR